MKVD
ncbi:e2a0c2b0-456d-4d15-a91c-ef4e2152160b [Thermothielavioides terrestris]